MPISFDGACLIVFGVMALIWRQKDWTNTGIKGMFIFMAFWAGLRVLANHHLLVRF